MLRGHESGPGQVLLLVTVWPCQALDEGSEASLASSSKPCSPGILSETGSSPRPVQSIVHTALNGLLATSEGPI